MKFEKKLVEKLDRCYAVNVIDINNEKYGFYATEGHGECFAYDCESFTKRAQVWEQPGGTMSMVPIPDKPGEFLAIQKFFRLYQWEEACLVWVKLDKNGKFQVKKMFTLPYLHRFDIVKRSGVNWLLCCTLAAHRDSKEDWTTPGSVYAGILPENPEEEIKLQCLKGDCFQNHGYTRVWKDDYSYGLITCQQGVFSFIPPKTVDGSWEIKKILNKAVSDVDVIDLDGDGNLEMAVIEQFHGRYFRIYKYIDGVWEKVYEHPEVTEFYHVVKAGTLCGEPVFLGGCRRGKQQLFAVSYRKDLKKYEMTVIDEKIGPSNVCIYNSIKGDKILVAGREIGQALVYEVSKDK